MQKREIWIPDKIDEIAQARAQAQGIDVSAFYAGLLSDHLLSVEPTNSNPTSADPKPSRISRKPEPPTFNYLPKEFEAIVDDPDEPVTGHFFIDFTMVDPARGLCQIGSVGHGGMGRTGFNVSRRFAGFPDRSIQYAQRLVDEAIKFRGVIPSEYRNKAGQTVGISFKPNFLMIEALLQRKAGIRVSLYGKPDDFTGKPSSFGLGRGGYSRIVVENDENLEKLLRLVPRAYELKFGSLPKEIETDRTESHRKLDWNEVIEEEPFK